MRKGQSPGCLPAGLNITNGMTCFMSKEYLLRLKELSCIQARIYEVRREMNELGRSWTFLG